MISLKIEEEKNVVLLSIKLNNFLRIKEDHKNNSVILECPEDVTTKLYEAVVSELGEARVTRNTNQVVIKMLDTSCLIKGLNFANFVERAHELIVE